MNRLELVRRRRGLTQTQLGLRLGIHPTNITMVEREHRRAWPKLRIKLAEELGVSVDELFNENGTLIGGD
ncbi:helix-turn-helix transcriptional regulator [Halobacillus salinarum]|uniref:Helix-turn-helix transcriptional regulator n=1 Tax=Halobacillus salinarum TaxID=2932257 RepID=A0ABY4EKF9_9BACI|nr:helix-turn-helix transcriptional regulator [Halobacillus salinarum]UOQ44581.1 helix-turn-helix transcriptional regulator [Halobacillus salinarum]